MSPDKSLSNIFDPLSSPPPLPASPAPAYTALPYRDTAFHVAPLLNNKLGEVELETCDGKRFLVHKKVLESETVFFHIYYGFVPLWRVQSQPHNLEPYHVSQTTVTAPPPAITSSPLNLLCLPKILSNLRHSPPPPPNRSESPPPAFSDLPLPPPPPLPPKDVNAPTPTTSPYTWVVPETASVLEAFLSLIYPTGTFAPNQLSSLDLTSKVVRAAMGYQSSKALSSSRDKLGEFIQNSPVEVYALACFFKFTDLAKLSSTTAMIVQPNEWTQESRALMGRLGAEKLLNLREERLNGLKRILERQVEKDEHSDTCVRRGMMEHLWQKHRENVKEGLKVESELLELLTVDLRGGHCGDCLVSLGETIRKCLLDANSLPKTI
ncbi:hypothetical protein TREMEDRAFT_62277 [Tremella mesenterica DSM 1558]|uniref:uncharacterized protein n=1 Tax=Tremella mesenterica (strain ATCC 24925 / CBS 8224 / DSM 1558 / NBRC 9311 / NRRL Y-6157 / RJB 2259-6 / UBC 559-6) TaxID=578456 RepID=UPI0003F49ED0|nr:uncharacterized protein TREMEDRAFT_62277 [Tremella mesenterica DSM 1558]EIW69411.1 hypothetical protein TREMEDRAFT_62277 [Tremella mesenterica DSM 1558]